MSATNNLAESSDLQGNKRLKEKIILWYSIENLAKVWWIRVIVRTEIKLCRMTLTICFFLLYSIFHFQKNTFNPN